MAQLLASLDSGSNTLPPMQVTVPDGSVVLAQAE
jgi:hypothetical protein